jgi:hypothetical protein
MMQGVEEIVARGQKRIHKLLRRLEVNQDGSETSSMETPAATTCEPPPERLRRMEISFLN